jgi:hypothetical protein
MTRDGLFEADVEKVILEAVSIEKIMPAKVYSPMWNAKDVRAAAK